MFVVIQSICSTFGAKLLDNFFRLALAHLAQSPLVPTQNLSQSILSLSTLRQPERIIAPDCRNGIDGVEPRNRWDRRTVELKTNGTFPPQQVFEQVFKGASELGEVWLESARVRIPLVEAHSIRRAHCRPGPCSRLACRNTLTC